MDYNRFSMQKKIRKVLVVSKQGHEKTAEISGELVRWLEERGIEAVLRENDEHGQRLSGLSGLDLVVVVGGDGTLISVARKVLDGGVPLLGLNMGQVGFLSEVEVSGWRNRLEKMLADGFETAERLALEFDVVRGGRNVMSDVAVNDLVVNRGTLARLIGLGLFLSGEPMGTLRSDGVIVSTPNGSTAYSISAGGPVLHPALEVFSVTPICPFLHNFRPIVLPGDAELIVEILEDRAEVYLTQDGQVGFRLRTGDRLVIRRHEPGPQFVKVPENAYVRKLRKKGVLE